MRIATLPAFALAAGIALAACSNIEQPQQPAPVAPPVGSSTLGPSGTAGYTNSPNAGSISNAASGSDILRMEGPAAGVAIPR